VGISLHQVDEKLLEHDSTKQLNYLHQDLELLVAVLT
jgi:hypothetical protein